MIDRADQSFRRSILSTDTTYRPRPPRSSMKTGRRVPYPRLSVRRWSSPSTPPSSSSCWRWSRDIEPPLDYAIPDSSPAANSSAEGLSRNEIRTTARAAKDENNKAGSTTATNRVFQIPNDERAKASSRYAAAKEDENKQTAYQNALYARLLEMGETNDLIRILKEERKEAEGEGDEGEVERIKARLKSLKRKRDGTSDKEMPTPPAAAK